MGWGFFVELQCSLPSRAWSALKKRTPAELALDASWSGVADPTLRAYLTAPRGEAAHTTFADALARGLFSVDSVREEAKDGKLTRIRVARLLDRDELDRASVLGALLAGVQAAGGEGTLAIVNDGSYAGEDGHELVVHDGVRSIRPLSAYSARRDALIAELHPESLEPDDEGAPDEGATERSAPKPSQAVADPDAAMAESIALYRRFEVDAARDRLTAYFEAGGAVTADLLANFAAFHHGRPAREPERRRAVDIVLASLDAEAQLRANLALMENAVLLLGAAGRAREAFDLALRAVGEGLAWSAVLATSATEAATTLGSLSRAIELAEQLDPLAEGATFESHPPFFVARAGCKLLLGDAEAAMQSLERAVGLDRKLRRHVADSDRFAPLHTHPRWSALVRRPGSR